MTDSTRTPASTGTTPSWEDRLHDWLVRRNPLNAPEGFRWDDDEVQAEKVDSWFGGFAWGLFIGWAVAIVVVVMT